MSSNTHFVTSPGGTQIAYDVTGTGTPLVLLHGGGQSKQAWHNAGYVSRLAGDFKVIGIDLRGNGESGKPGRASVFERSLMPWRGIFSEEWGDFRSFGESRPG